MRGWHGAFSHASILIKVITGNGSLIGCNAATHYSLILLLELHKVVTELGASCMVQLVPFGFRAIPHLQQQSLGHMRSSGTMKSKMQWCGLHALGKSGTHVGSQPVLDSQESGCVFADNFRRNLFVCLPFGDQRRSSSDSIMEVSGADVLCMTYLQCLLLYYCLAQQSFSMI